LLQRIHKRTLGTLRKQIEPVPPAVFLEWLLRWQHVAAGAQMAGESGLLQALRQMEGFEAPAVEWERRLLPQRVAQYDPRWLDALCLSGQVGWGRLSPHPAWAAAEGAPRRVVPTSMAPIAFYVRESAAWLEWTLEAEAVDPARLREALSAEAQQVREILESRGACFLEDLMRRSGLLRTQVERALWEMAAAGLAVADSFDALRMLIDPRRRTATESSQRRSKKLQQSISGRWSLLREPAAEMDIASRMRARDTAIESAAKVLLARYGVIFRDLLTRESAMPRWRELLPMLRRMEARGEVRGGRFISGFSGEQFALAEVVPSLRAMREMRTSTECEVAAADPMNLVGVIVPGEKVSAVPGRTVRFSGGMLAGTADEVVIPEEEAAPMESA
jgi:ATP-dependent helicase Lhr and Lhr-like helicase